ncbi:MAG TPA: FAD-dependent oxidoreductase, partial [Gemmatimonadaceae bacterium]|nr:FAD-dependent oxidoreductase [Gemmatimonadaceae bacterium]
MIWPKDAASDGGVISGSCGRIPYTSAMTGVSGETFDLLIIGGGINGCGVARDAAMRGLSVVLLERDDFGSGTSGRSSRLIHGGIRYLEQGQLHL